jgi:hypothetical protein
MRYPKYTVISNRLIPLTVLALATALGGCVAYTGYPSSGYGYSNSGGYPSAYSYNYPSGYYAGYPGYGYRPYYSPGYSRYNGSYDMRGGNSAN